MSTRALRWRVIVVQSNGIPQSHLYASESDALVHANAVRVRYGKYVTVTVERFR